MAEVRSTDRDDEREAIVPGTTAVLTAEGWESSEYVEPGDDWLAEPDGSLTSPDGSIRTWTTETRAQPVESRD